MSLLHRRAAHRSCHLHGDNGCEIQGEAGPRERAQDKRVWMRDVAPELSDALDRMRAILAANPLGTRGPDFAEGLRQDLLDLAGPRARATAVLLGDDTPPD